MIVKCRRVLLSNDHDNSKWIVLQAYVDGLPQLTKTGTISTAALADGSVTIEGERQRLIDTVNEYHIRWVAAEVAIAALDK